MRTITQVYLVLSVLAGVPAGASRMVLCVASNGHVVIEPGGERCAGNTLPIVEASAPSGPLSMADDYRNCVDVPMGIPVLSEARGRGADSGTVATAALAWSEPVALVPIAAIRAGSVPTAASHAAFSPSRTTILRN